MRIKARTLTNEELAKRQAEVQRNVEAAEGFGYPPGATYWFAKSHETFAIGSGDLELAYTNREDDGKRMVERLNEAAELREALKAAEVALQHSEPLAVYYPEARQRHADALAKVRAALALG
jgi:hypothetical protein